MKLIKKAVEIGNGAAIYVPKHYAGQDIEVLLPEELGIVKSKILSKLIGHLPQIIGIYIYGSYVRGERTPKSDVDLLIITEKNEPKIREVIAGENIDVRILTRESLKKLIINFPAITIPILKEAQPIINSSLLDDFKKLASKPNPKKFSFHIQDTERTTKLIESFIKLDDKEIAASHVYSLIMRLRILFMIETILKNKIFTNKNLKEKLVFLGMKNKEFYDLYSLYQKLRDDETFEGIIKKEKIIKLLNITKKYLKEIKNESKKASGKGH